MTTKWSQRLEEQRGSDSDRGDACGSGESVGGPARGMRLLRRDLCCSVRVAADDDYRFTQCTHALDQVGCPWRCRVLEHDENIASLGQLVIPPHAGNLPEPLPIRAEALMAPGVLPGPAVAEQFCAPSPACENLRDAMTIRRQHPAQALVVGKCT